MYSILQNFQSRRHLFVSGYDNEHAIVMLSINTSFQISYKMTSD